MYVWSIIMPQKLIVELGRTTRMVSAFFKDLSWKSSYFGVVNLIFKQKKNKKKNFSFYAYIGMDFVYDFTL